MKNKGFSIIECVFCLLLLSAVTVGIFSVTYHIKEDNMTRMYENAMLTNYHTIFRVCDLSKNPKDKIIDVYKDLVKEVNDDSLIIEIDLKYPYYQKKSIMYQVTFEETKTNNIVYVEILNLDYRFEEINNETITKRVYPK